MNIIRKFPGYVLFNERVMQSPISAQSPVVAFQEQLAFVLETMTLYEDALVQYDELDALLTQFVINAAHERENPEWLQNLTECKDSWRALCMKSVCPVGDRGPFKDSRGSLLDLRNMLLVRICNILILLCRYAVSE